MKSEENTAAEVLVMILLLPLSVWLYAQAGAYVWTGFFVPRARRPFRP